MKWPFRKRMEEELNMQPRSTTFHLYSHPTVVERNIIIQDDNIAYITHSPCAEYCGFEWVRVTLQSGGEVEGYVPSVEVR